MIHFRAARNRPHPEDPKAKISEWEWRIWKFRRAIEILVFDEEAEHEEDEDLQRVKIEAEQGNLPEEYYLYLIGAFDAYPLDLPVNWLLAREIIKEIISVQERNDAMNRENLASLGDNEGVNVAGLRSTK